MDIPLILAFFSSFPTFSDLGTGGGLVSLSLSGTNFLPNAAAGTVIGTLSVPGGTGSYTYTFTSNPGALFQIVGSQVQVLSATIAAGSYPVTIQATGGIPTPVTATFTLQAVGLPTVTGISPTSGPAAGGTPVTITGTNFVSVTAVKFGATNAASFTVNSPTQITATSPAGSGTVDITVTAFGGTSVTSSADQFTYSATLSGHSIGLLLALTYA